MAEDKTQLFGGDGIDTEEERRIINYRPVLETSKKESTGVIMNEDAQYPSDMEEDEENNPATQTYIEISDTYEYISDLLTELETTLSDTVIPISSEWQDKLQEASIKLDGISEEIPFSVYKEALANPKHPTNSIIIDAVNEYAEDINGTVQLELYSDVRDMYENLNELHYLMGKALYNQLIPSSQIPSTPEFDESFFTALKEQEDKQYEAYTALNNLYNVNRQIYYDALANDYESEDYFKALEEFNATKREQDDFVRRLNQQKEFSSFGSMDSMMTQKTAKRINRQVQSEPYLEETDVHELLNKQYEKPEQVLEASSLMQVAVKLQVNNQIEQKKQKSDVLNTTGSLEIKKRVHDEVINLVNARNTVFLDLYDMMNNMVDPVRKTGVERFLDQVAEGMELVRANYKTYLQEMYQIHMIDQEVRYDKVNLVQDKQMARESYWLLDNILK